MTTTATETAETPDGLGPSLRLARRSKSLSLSDVASATGISASFLSLVENGKSDITIGRLVRLVAFYGVQLGDLIPSTPSAEPDIIRRAEQRRLPSSETGIEFRLLAADSAGSMMPMVVEFAPRARLAEYGRHAGEEFVHVLQGRLELDLEGSEPRILKAGDSAYYSAERPHLFRNASDTAPLRIICVDWPPNL
jgi:quercetin dioxygenase-like cupin family protein/DNA-binding Xre family transcriptional regulator